MNSAAQIQAIPQSRVNPSRRESRPRLFSEKVGALLVGIFLFCAGNLIFQPAVAEEAKNLSIEVIPLQDASGNTFLPHAEQFEVRLSNSSDQQVIIWDDLCQLGHFSLSFNVKGADGVNRTVQKRTIPDSDWKEPDFSPKTVLIPPKKNYSLKVNLSDVFWGKWAWQNVPEPNTGEKITLSAVFEIKPTVESNAQGVWTGRVESSVLKITLVNTNLTTPQDYLWNACPQQALKLLKKDSSLINSQEKEYQYTPLHIAVSYGYKEVVVWLLAHGANVNAVAFNQYTPMHIVNDSELAGLLIRAGADLNKKDVWGKIPLQSAAEDGRTNICDVILKSGFPIDLSSALWLGRRDLALKLIKEHPTLATEVNSDSYLEGNDLPLGIAAGQGDKEIVEALLKAGAPVNSVTDMPNAGPATALCNAVWAGHYDIAKILCEAGADCNMTGGKFYDRILDFALKNSDTNMVNLLVMHGAQPTMSPK